MPKSTEKLVVDVRFNKVKPFINWNLFLQAWQIKGETRKQEEGKRLLNDAKQLKIDEYNNKLDSLEKEYQKLDPAAGASAGPPPTSSTK